MELQQLLSMNQLEELVIHSHGMSLYTLEVTALGASEVVTEAGRPVSFRSTQHIRDALEHLRIENSWLQHHCAYDEMIGQVAENQVTQIPFRL